MIVYTEPRSAYTACPDLRGEPRRANSQRRLPRTNRGSASLGILQSATSSLSNRPSDVPSCAKAQKHLSATPLFAALTDSLSRNPFVCHSYANTRGVGYSRYKFLLRFPPATARRSQVTSYHALARSFSLFALFFACQSFVFNNFQTLLRKHRGWGCVEHLFALPSGVTDRDVFDATKHNGRKKNKG